jgi:predicted MPP superfamily phosphohydrolase
MPLRFLIFGLSALGLSLALDFYGFQLVRAAVKGLSPEAQRVAFIAFWSFPAITLIGFLYFGISGGPMSPSSSVKAWASGLFFSHFVFGLVLALLATAQDIQRLLFAVFRFLGVKTGLEPLASLPLTRSAFLSQAALAIAAIPAAGMLYGVVRGGHRYQIRRQQIYLPNLPSAFEGFKIVHISDIHSGSFFSRAGVQRGIDLVNAQGADLVVFTGDLVNNLANEIEPWIDRFKTLKAQHGVFSILGNHDYGEYVEWPSHEAKAENLQRLKDHHAQLGWRLLVDENTRLNRGGQEIALIGIQNWSARANFPRYGDLQKAYKGAESAPVKILLSHDPSHWRAQVRPEFKEIDLTLSGHTHGMQFGIDTEVMRHLLKWSPVQYVYHEWAGLYEEAGKYLYVNRGFGFIGYPGRLGIWPEITVLELKSKTE